MRATRWGRREIRKRKIEREAKIRKDGAIRACVKRIDHENSRTLIGDTEIGDDNVKKHKRGVCTTDQLVVSKVTHRRKAGKHGRQR